ncbi:MAG: hypothetical protein GY906_10105 [bacterium]|nr:hypothetical protein [bacterium]
MIHETTRVENEDGLRCQAECWGEIPTTLLIDEDDNTCCGDCDHIIQTGDGDEPDHDPGDFPISVIENRIMDMGVEPRSDTQFYEGY